MSMNKLNIIEKCGNEMFLTLQNISLPLLPFKHLNMNISDTDPHDMKFDIKTCNHKWVALCTEQVRMGDEAQTTLFECSLCQNKKCV